MRETRTFGVTGKVSAPGKRHRNNDANADGGSPARPRARVASFLRDEKGSSVIEFALMSMPFFLSVMFIVEMGMLFFANVILEDSVSTAARQIRTGEFQAGAATETDFRNLICPNIKVLMSCDTDKLYFDVRVFNQFGNVAFDDPLEDGDISNGLQFDPGVAEDIVLARVYYTWKMFTPFFGDLLDYEGQDYHLLNVNFAFRNEPY